MNCDVSKLAPGMWCFSNFSWYSSALMPRKAKPKSVVRTRKRTRRDFLRTSAAQTASAMKKPEEMRIAVLTAPSGTLSWFDAVTKAS